MSKYYSCPEIARMFGVRIMTVWDWIRKGKLGAYKVGREYRVSAEDVEAFENACRVRKNG